MTNKEKFNYKKYHRGFPAKGNPATKAARIPMHINSWFTDPSVPRISVGEICIFKGC